MGVQLPTLWHANDNMCHASASRSLAFLSVIVGNLNEGKSFK